MRRWTIRAAIVVAAAAAGFWLWSWSGAQRDESRGLRGGPLFSFTTDQVVALEIRRPQGTSRLERAADGTWALTGLVEDLVDSARVVQALDQLTAGAGLPVLAGTEPDERRFGLGGDDSVELVFHLRDGGRDRLALGDVNPVSEMIYASGAGRRGVFGVGGGMYAIAARLPDSVRQARLLPPVAAAALDSLHLDRRDDARLAFAPAPDGRWWLRLPGGAAALTGKAARYHQLYGDRREVRDGVDWGLADLSRLREIVFRASDTAVVEFPVAAAFDPADLAEVGLSPPYRTLTLFRTGGTPWQVEFGEEQVGDRKLVAARRLGAYVVTRSEALRQLEGPVSGFLDLGALSFRVEFADSFRIDAVDGPLLWGDKAADPAARRRALQSVWDPVVPAGWRAVYGLETTADHLADVQIYLDRLECVEVREPALGDPLRRDGRWRVRAWLPGGRDHEVWLGRLGSDGRAAVWEPRDGKVLVVPEEILVSLHNLRGDLSRPNAASGAGP
ncbi:MAG TPA: hypothetical protein PLL30_09970 [Candidatus Krumholzibacteria bacterium]|nr:hypothetical protein [Candidatus Krumholzibacteria bacterium]HPD72086.1 hypothetical protein [Candidatus Krumholzibacteria bacterium]HRY40982.1 hypothetical protein [Candidatus Krumholzibacteria bacterium]